MDQWLIRTSDNWIAGPYPAAQVRQMILTGELSYQDEICSASHYWVYLYEREEVMKQLGIEVPMQSPIEKKDDEITETEFLLDETTDPNFSPGGATTMAALVTTKAKSGTAAPSSSPHLKTQDPVESAQPPVGASALPKQQTHWGKKLGLVLLGLVVFLVVIALTRWVRF